MLLAFLLLVTPTVRLQASGEVKVGAAAPAFGGWDVGEKSAHSLPAIRKATPGVRVVISFGASWCPPCERGLKLLEALVAKQKVPAQLVVVDVESDAKAARRWVKELGLHSLVILDKFEQIAKTCGLSEGERITIPRTFVLDAEGRVRSIYREEGDDFAQAVQRDLE